MHKGDRIGIEGRLQQRSWEKDGQKHYAVEVVVDSFQFLNSPKADSGKSDPAPESGKADNPFNDNDIPF